MQVTLRHNAQFSDVWGLLGDCYQSIEIRCIAERTTGGASWHSLMIVAVASGVFLTDAILFAPQQAVVWAH